MALHQTLLSVWLSPKTFKRDGSLIRAKPSVLRKTHVAMATFLCHARPERNARRRPPVAKTTGVVANHEGIRQVRGLAPATIDRTINCRSCFPRETAQSTPFGWRDSILGVGRALTSPAYDFAAREPGLAHTRCAASTGSATLLRYPTRQHLKKVRSKPSEQRKRIQQTIRTGERE